jgi:hypothetical protein
MEWFNDFGSSLASGMGTIGSLYLGQQLMPSQKYRTKTISSPESQAALEAFMPALRRIGEAATKGKQLYEVPQAPLVDYNPGQYAPSAGWFSGLDPSITQGMWEPYNQGANQLAEQLSSFGGLGSARGGVSGMGAAGLGKFWENASQNVGMNAWNMMGPTREAQAAQTSAAQNAAMQQWLQQILATQSAYGPVAGIVGGAMPTPALVPSGGK